MKRKSKKQGSTPKVKIFKGAYYTVAGSQKKAVSNMRRVNKSPVSAVISVTPPKIRVSSKTFMKAKLA